LHAREVLVERDVAESEHDDGEVSNDHEEQGAQAHGEREEKRPSNHSRPNCSTPLVTFPHAGPSDARPRESVRRSVSVTLSPLLNNAGSRSVI